MTFNILSSKYHIVELQHPSKVQLKFCLICHYNRWLVIIAGNGEFVVNFLLWKHDTGAGVLLDNLFYCFRLSSLSHFLTVKIVNKMFNGEHILLQNELVPVGGTSQIQELPCFPETFHIPQNTLKKKRQSPDSWERPDRPSLWSCHKSLYLVFAVLFRWSSHFFFFF